MPEVYSMSRWNEEDKYGEKPMLGDRVVHSIKHKKPKRVFKRGCPENNHGPHYYAATKSITVYVDRDRPVKNQINYRTHCIFCYKGGKSYYSWKTTPHPPASLEVLKTEVRTMGRFVRDETGYHLTYDKHVVYDGETDQHGKIVTR